MSEAYSKTKFISIIVFLLIVAGFIVINILKDKGDSFEVQSTTVKRGDITQIVSGYGKIQATKEVKISANVGAEIKKLYVKEGDHVTKDQLLVDLDRTRYEAILERTQYDLQSAETNLTNCGIRLKRSKELFSSDFISKSALEDDQLKLDLAEQQVDQAKAMLKQTKDDLSKTRLISPINGTVVRLDKEVGEMALSSQFQTDVIMTVGDLSQMEMVVEIDESEVTLVTEGNSAIIEIDAIPDKKFKGIVSEIANKAKTKGQGTQEEVTVFESKIRIIDKNLQSLRPGMSATVEIQTQTHKNVLFVPIQSITTRDIIKKDNTDLKGQVVFVIKNKKTKLVPVETGIMNNTDVEITKGLTENQEIVIGSFRTLSKQVKDGSLVTVNNKKSSTIDKTNKKDKKNNENADIDGN